MRTSIDALRCFFSTGLDVLVPGNYIVDKERTAIVENMLPVNSRTVAV